jgi:MFS family permease
VPFFFFASVYSQVSLAKSSSDAGVYILYFFLGFVILSQLGGRLLDRRGARPPIILGCALGAVGFYLLAGRVTDLSLNKQMVDIMLAGGGLGLILSPASTDAVNRAPRTSYSEVTGITQTARNFGASVGMAVLGTVLITSSRTNVAHQLTKVGVPPGTAHHVASTFSFSASSQGATGHEPPRYLHAVQLAFAQSTQTVFYIMAAVMAVTFFLAIRLLPRGPEPVTQAYDPLVSPVDGDATPNSS